MTEVVVTTWFAKTSLSILSDFFWNQKSPIAWEP